MGGNNIRIIILDEPYFIAMSSDLTGRLIIQSSDVFIANSFGVVFISCSMQQQQQQRECPKNSGKFMVAHKPYDTIFLLGMRPLLKTLKASTILCSFQFHKMQPSHNKQLLLTYAYKPLPDQQLLSAMQDTKV